jgi:hypothetical protein
MVSVGQVRRGAVAGGHWECYRRPAQRSTSRADFALRRISREFVGTDYIGVPDSKRAQAFCGGLFGWQFPPFGKDDQVWVQSPTMKAGLA